MLGNADLNEMRRYYVRTSNAIATHRVQICVNSTYRHRVNARGKLLTTVDRVINDLLKPSWPETLRNEPPVVRRFIFVEFSRAQS